MSSSNLDWIKPGASAYIVQDSPRAALVCRGVTIERVLKRDVVLDNGSRFALTSPEFGGGRGLMKRDGSAWSPSTLLLPEGDPRIEATRAAIRLSRARSNALLAVDEFRAGRTTATEVASAWSEFAEVQP